jgi:methylthioribose-1-phosphate isomerase
MLGFKPLEYRQTANSIVILDQTQLPEKERYEHLKTVDDVYEAIKSMKLRGAPLIGIAAAYGVVLTAHSNELESILKAADYLGTARPTAVNLSWAIKRMKDVAAKSENLFEELLKEAQAIEQEDRNACQYIGQYGSELVKDRAKIMVYCNAGALATSGIGTALGIIYTAENQNKNPVVYACETRPLLQGARLTSWELTKNRIKTYVISDNMAATYMPEMNLAIVGADRIALNGDTANKIGTRGLAIIARYNNVPFYVAAPLSTFDFSIETGTDIPIEMRFEDELRKFNNKKIVADRAGIYNPAFDITPADLISGIITEKGIIEQPDRTKIEKLKNTGLNEYL